jgi:Protein of unknown function (DUF2845)
MPRALLLAAILAVTLTATARADGMRCPAGGLISTGDSKEQVLGKCGEPTDRKVTQTVPCGRHGRCPLEIAEWRYDFGPCQFQRLLVFVGGRLDRITVLGYGNR